MSYLVLARKWRPLHFEDLAGQDHVTRTISNAFEQNRLHHAFLFTGARGVGKTSCARILAKALNCHEGPTAKPCYRCQSCEEITEGSSVDVFEIDGASNRGIDEIRNLRDGVKYAPCRDRFKVYIIDEVHMLTEAAFNALLKTLEEPPSHVKFIMATTEPQKIPATILSRCQRYDFKRIPPTSLVTHLQKILQAEEVNVSLEGLQLIVREAEGSFRDALSLLDQVISYSGGNATTESVCEILGLGDRRNLHQISQALLEHDPQAALNIINRVHAHGYDLAQFAGELLRHIRDQIILATCKNPQGLVDLPDSEITRQQELVQGVNPQVFQRQFTILVKALEELTRSSFAKLILEMAIVRMASLAPPAPVSNLIHRLEELQQRVEIMATTPDGKLALQGVPARQAGGHPGDDRALAGATPAPTSGPHHQARPPKQRAPEPTTGGRREAYLQELSSIMAADSKAPAKAQAEPPAPAPAVASTERPEPAKAPSPPRDQAPQTEAPRDAWNWETMVDTVRAERPLLAAILDQTRPLSTSNGEIELLVEPPADLMGAQIEEHKDYLIQTWSRLAGTPAPVTIKLTEGDSSSDRDNHPPSLDEIHMERERVRHQALKEKALGLPHINEIKSLLGGEVKRVEIFKD